MTTGKASAASRIFGALLVLRLGIIDYNCTEKARESAHHGETLGRAMGKPIYRDQLPSGRHEISRQRYQQGPLDRHMTGGIIPAIHDVQS